MLNFVKVILFKFCPFNLFLIESNLVKGDNICDHLGHILRQLLITSIILCTYFQELSDLILVIYFIFIFSILVPSRVTQKPKYPILIFPKNEFSILHLSYFSFSLLSVTNSFCKSARWQRGGDAGTSSDVNWNRAMAQKFGKWRRRWQSNQEGRSLLLQ